MTVTLQQSPVGKLTFQSPEIYPPPMTLAITVINVVIVTTGVTVGGKNIITILWKTLVGNCISVTRNR
jgi:hypothetical protein